VIYAGGNNSGTDSVQVFTTVDGAIFTNSGFIKITSNDAGMGIAQITPGGDFLTSRYSGGSPIRLYSGTGAGRLDAVPTAVTPAFQADITYLEAAGRKWIASVESLASAGHNHKAVLLNATYGLSGAVKVGVTPAIGTAANTSSLGADVELQYNAADSTMTVFVLVDNNGFGAFKTGNLLTTNYPPFVGVIRRTQYVPLNNQPDTLLVDVQDDQYVPGDSVRLSYSVDGGANTIVAMTRISGDSVKGTYQGIIPGSVNLNGKRIAYTVMVSDNMGVSFTSPLKGYFAGLTSLSLTGPRSIDSNGVLLYDAYAIRINGICIQEDSITSQSQMDAVIQDKDGGITLFKSGTILNDFTRGRNYTIEGELDHFRGKLELIVPFGTANFVYSDNGSAIFPKPRVVTVADLQWGKMGETVENMLVMIHHVMQTPVSNPWPAPGASGGALNMGITENGVDTITMRLAQWGNLPGLNPKPPYTVVGVAGQYNSVSSSPFTNGYQIIPLDAKQIIPEVMVHMKDTTRGMATTEVVVPVMIPNINGMGITGYNFDLLFDSTALQFVNASNVGSISAGYTFATNMFNGASVRIVASGAAALVDSGELFTMKFKILKPGPNNVMLNGTFNEGSPMAFVKGGTILGHPAPVFQDPKMLPVFASMNVVMVDGKLDEPIWHAATPYLVFGPAAFHPDSLARTVTGGVNVKPTVPYLDTTYTQLKFARRGPHFFIGFRSKDQSVSRFGDSWEGDGLFVKIKNAAGIDKEFKLFFNLAGNSVIHYEATDSAHGFGMAMKHPSTIVNDTTAADSGYTAELVIKLDLLGYTKYDSVQLMINIFDPDGFTGNNPAFGPIGSFYKSWWGSEWGPDMRWVKFLPDSSPTGVNTGLVLPTAFALDQNYPNPFNPSTTMKFALVSDQYVRLAVYDLLGREVRSLINTDMSTGFHQVVWDGKNNKGTSVASGIYIYRIEAGSFITSKKMMLLK
ncbi:MAG: T9SS type A sorting domain-containing protein, partial [Bacteroidetes bacterium]|nr:T9SS type A sorting domain-containing protein [Bacteroidota bacterium]